MISVDRSVGKLGHGLLVPGSKFQVAGCLLADQLHPKNVISLVEKLVH